MNIDRKLASVRKIEEIQDIPNADAIQAFRVDGWWVVDKKGAHRVGDLVVYLEVDSWVPTELAPFLSKGKEPREYNNVKGERLRTVRLRGQLSQGLLLPYAVLGRIAAEGEDVTEELGIQKWEAPIPAQLAGNARGNFPSIIQKTDQPRIQNCNSTIEHYGLDTWEVTEKLHGSSFTALLDRDLGFRVCSRNLDLQEDPDNAYWKVAIKYDIQAKLQSLLDRIPECHSVAIQAELCGPGINGNQYGLSKLDLFVFDLLSRTENMPQMQKSNSQIRLEIVHELGLKHVPVLATHMKLDKMNVSSVLEFAEGKSLINGSNREGVVFKSNEHPEISFKAVSNSWLLKNE